MREVDWEVRWKMAILFRFWPGASELSRVTVVAQQAVRKISAICGNISESKMLGWREYHVPVVHIGKVWIQVTEKNGCFRIPA